MKHLIAAFASLAALAPTQIASAAEPGVPIVASFDAVEYPASFTGSIFGQF